MAKFIVISITITVMLLISTQNNHQTAASPVQIMPTPTEDSPRDIGAFEVNRQGNIEVTGKGIINRSIPLLRNKRDSAAAKPSTIKPGSRAASRFDNDPTVSCIENPYQTRCPPHNTESKTKWYHSTYYSTDNFKPNVLESERYACVDFYNQSDDQLLWWQKLQQQATFKPEYGVVYMANDDQCPNEDQINFYLSDRAHSSKKYVDWHRGLHLRQPNKINYVVNVCFTTHNKAIPETYGPNVLYSFLYCLFEYGVGLENME